MGRPKSIRFTKNDKTEYDKLVRNSKAKIKRTFKNYGIDLSNEITIPKVSDFKTRKEFNEFKSQIKNFTNRNNTNYQFVKNKYGVVASKKEINEARRTANIARRVAKKVEKQVANKPFMQGGKESGTVKQRMLQMGKPNVAGIYIPPKFDFDKIHSRRQFTEKVENLTERSDPQFLNKRAEKMKENYIKSLNENFNSDSNDVIQMVLQVPASDFFELYIMNDEMEFAYHYTEEEGLTHLAKISSVLTKYFAGEVNMDLKGF